MVLNISHASQEKSVCLAIGSRDAGLAALKDFCTRVDAYAKLRNYDLPGRSNVSQLSPYLRTRLLTEREVVEAVLEEHAYSSVSKFIDEVCWRTYWKGWLEHHPSVWQSYLNSLQTSREELSDLQKIVLGHALKGTTGLQEFDHWTEELMQTGYLHNHVRMWYASIWIFTLNLPWQLGAQHFLRHLLDGDPASNTLSWRWVAGLQTKGKVYLARQDNIRKYTNGRYGDCQLAPFATAKVESQVHETIPLEPLCSISDACLPCLSSSPAGLLVLPEDLSPESSGLSDCPFSSICVFNADDVVAPFHFSENVQRFYQAAIRDTAFRLAREWNGEIVNVNCAVAKCFPKASPSHVGLKCKPRVYCGQVEHWVESVVHWAVRESLKSVRLFRPPVGPWQSMLGELEYALAENGIRLYQYRREWDSLHWPHTKRGYFQFRKDLKSRLMETL